MRRKGFFPLILVLVLGGCALHHPLEVVPPKELPKNFSLAPEKVRTFFPERPWWLSFGDQKLNQLIEEAFQANLDLKAGVARILKAQAILKEALSFSFPSTSLEYSWRRSKEPGFFGENQGTSYRLSSTASYELDLWGRIRSSAKASLAELKATQEDLRAFYLSLAAQVADTYYLLAALEQEKAKLDLLIKTLTEELALVEDLYSQGLIEADELLSVKTQLFELTKQRTELEEKIFQARHALAILLGRYPEEAPRPSLVELPTLDQAFPLGLPSQVIMNRPDVRAAYWRVKAADARVAAAVAERFPRLNLLASFGRSHTAFSIGDIVGSFWSVSLDSTLSLFEAGRKGARVEQEKAAALEALYHYQQTVLRAFKEVEDALSANITAQKRLTELNGEESSLKTLLSLNLDRYHQGLADYLSVLKTRVELLRTEQAKVQAKQALISARISLYRALGGTWMEKYLKDFLVSQRGPDE